MKRVQAKLGVVLGVSLAVHGCKSNQSKLKDVNYVDSDLNRRFTYIETCEGGGWIQVPDSKCTISQITPGQDYRVSVPSSSVFAFLKLDVPDGDTGLKEIERRTVEVSKISDPSERSAANASLNSFRDRVLNRSFIRSALANYKGIANDQLTCLTNGRIGHSEIPCTELEKAMRMGVKQYSFAETCEGGDWQKVDDTKCTIVQTVSGQANPLSRNSEPIYKSLGLAASQVVSRETLNARQLVVDGVSNSSDRERAQQTLNDLRSKLTQREALKNAITKSNGVKCTENDLLDGKTTCGILDALMRDQIVGVEKCQSKYELHSWFSKNSRSPLEPGNADLNSRFCIHVVGDNEYGIQVGLEVAVADGETGSKFFVAKSACSKLSLGGKKWTLPLSGDGDDSPREEDAGRSVQLLGKYFASVIYPIEFWSGSTREQENKALPPPVYYSARESKAPVEESTGLTFKVLCIRQQ